MSAPYRVLVTGSRDWADWETVWAALAPVVTTVSLSFDREVIVVHGACPTGADRIAHDWATQYGATIERHPADWTTHGRAAGFRRNAEMVNLGADVALAFIGPCANTRCRRPQPHGSHGATHCADLAERAGIPVRRWGA